MRLSGLQAHSHLCHHKRQEAEEVFTHPYIASHLNSDRIARFHKEAAADAALRQARAARRQAKANDVRRQTGRMWFRRPAVTARLSNRLS